MLTRIYRLLEDSRFEFLFGPCAEEWPAVRHALATFLRDILGLESGAEASLSAEDDMAAGVLPFYDRQRATAQKANVVIVDLSLLASEVLENVTALIGRLIHEFLQRLSDPISGVGRGEFPIVLVLEEAQNYIRETGRSEEDSISKQVFERIAREGRKYGLGLVVASQRPSELSKTVLSQCNSFIVHRLQNPEDLRYFREIVPGIYVQLLNQLPALAPRSALVLGECVQAPVLVVMRECDPQPRSKNPKFFKSWTSDVRVPDVEAVCAKWEGTQAPTPQGVAGESAIADGQP
jgi:DNA helicase HerA-like ATPase